jgi:preprotein translocase subunit SecG
MNNRTQIIMAVIAAVLVIGVCLIWRSCGTEATVTCPNGGSATLHSRGSFEGGTGIEEICKKLEGKK